MADADTPQKQQSANQPQIRVDPLSGLKVIVAGSRASRPGGFTQLEKSPPIDAVKDPFAEGNEGQTPPEVWADRPNELPDTPGWHVRAVPNLYPALVEDDESARGTSSTHADPLVAGRGSPDFFQARVAAGRHEVVVNSPRPLRSLSQVSADQMDRVIAAWRARMRAHTAARETAYVHLIVNEGKEAGASLEHTHAQLFALPFVPATIARERERFQAYFEHTQGQNLLEDLIAEETRIGERLIAVDDHSVLIAPFASRSPFQMMLVPRKPHPSFEEDAANCGAMLHDAFRRLTRVHGASPPLNLWVRTSPDRAGPFCWRIDIVPRLAQPAGMEIGAGVFINALAPEQTAAILREA